MVEVYDETETPESPPPPSFGNFRSTAQFGKPSFNDISYGPKPPSQFPALSSSPKRKLDCTQLEEDDLSQFKRVRLVLKERGKKKGPFLCYQAGGAIFDATQQQKKDEQTAWDEFRALQVSMGSTHPDTLTYMHSFTRSLRNWGKYQTAEMLIRDALKSGESELLAHRPESLQIMLSGLMVVLVDQQKLSEADNLWNTSLETFRTKLGEHSANVLENQFQQAHPFRHSSNATLKIAVFGGANQGSIEPLSMAPNLTNIDLGKEFRNYGLSTPTYRDEVQLDDDNHRMRIKKRPSLKPLPPPTTKENGGQVSKKGIKGKYSLTDFEILRTLGTGSFARVRLVQSKHNHQFYALKVWKKKQIVKMKQVEHTCDEIQCLSKIKHPFLMCLWGTFQDSKNLYMVSDFVEGGELFSLLRRSQVRI